MTLLHRWASTLAALCLSAPALSAAAHRLPLGDAERGRALLQSALCLQCHQPRRGAVRNAPDLSALSQRSFSPYQLAAAMWNSAPRMWRAMEKERIQPPQLTAAQAADLFALFFAAQFSAEPGDARRGQEVFRQKRCAACHDSRRPSASGGPPISAWTSVRDPIELAREAWQHGDRMRQALDQARIPPPNLSPREMADLIAYVRRACPSCGAPLEFVPGAVEPGRQIFSSKGCAACHHGGLDLQRRPTRYGLHEFAAAMWNHALRPDHPSAGLTYPEMKQLLAYLVALQFVEEKGSPEQGRDVYLAKGCARCHDHSETGAPPLSSRLGRLTSYDMIEVLWKHGPAMHRKMAQLRIPWPRFQGSEMADLTAWLHGVEFRPR